MIIISVFCAQRRCCSSLGVLVQNRVWEHRGEEHIVWTFVDVLPLLRFRLIRGFRRSIKTLLASWQRRKRVFGHWAFMQSLVRFQRLRLIDTPARAQSHGMPASRWWVCIKPFQQQSQTHCAYRGESAAAPQKARRHRNKCVPFISGTHFNDSVCELTI